MTPPVPLAVEAASVLASLIQDRHDRAMIEQLIATRTEGRRMPSSGSLPPLGQVAACILDGDGTDDAAQYWLRMAGHYHDADPDTACRCSQPGTYASQAPAITGTYVREGRPGDTNDPERYPEG